MAYLHSVVRLMRVQYLLETIATETRAAIEQNFPPLSAYIDTDSPAAGASRALVYTGRSGVITACDLYGLVELCRRYDCWLELTVGVGEYISPQTRFAIVHGAGPEEHQVVRFLLVAGERSFFQDPAFGFRQLVDTACRALSPAVNDPGELPVQAIDRISDLLVLAGSNPDPTGFRVDSSGTVRLRRQLRNFEALLVLAMTEIVRYGADAPQLVRRLHAVLDDLERTLPAVRHAALARQRELLNAAVATAMPAPYQAISSIADRQGIG